MSEIDYSKYNLRELYESRNNVDKQKFPRNAELIEHWIKMREAEIPPASPEPKNQIEHQPVVGQESVEVIQEEPIEPEIQTIEYSSSTKFYVSAKGRIGRADYWLGGIPIAIMLYIIEHFVKETNDNLYLGISLALACPAFILAIKRAHDRNKSGWFAILLLVPIVSLWPMIELGFLKGTSGKNRFGRDPLISRQKGLTN